MGNTIVNIVNYFLGEEPSNDRYPSAVSQNWQSTQAVRYDDSSYFDQRSNTSRTPVRSNAWGQSWNHYSHQEPNQRNNTFRTPVRPVDWGQIPLTNHYSYHGTNQSTSTVRKTYPTVRETVLVVVSKSCNNPNFITQGLSILRGLPCIMQYMSIVNTYSDDYALVMKRLGKKFLRDFEIGHISKVDNKYLLLSFEVKKLQYQRRFGYAEETLLFHGTNAANIGKICERNFDWRLAGKSKGHKFGHGVSFSSSPFYSSHYGDYLILTKVLLGKCCRGNMNTIIPPNGYDSTTNHDRKVFVKYEDNTFYPAFVIEYFKLDDESDYDFDDYYE